MPTPVNRTTNASTIMSAAPRSRQRTALGSRFILQALQIEVATVDSNRLGCFWWNRGACAGLACVNNARQGGDLGRVPKQNALPIGFHHTNVSCLVANSPAMRRREIVQVGGEIEEAISGSGIYQRATCRIYYSDRHPNCLYVLKADAFRIGERCLVWPFESVPRDISQPSVLEKIVIFKPKNARTNYLVILAAAIVRVVIVVDGGSPWAADQGNGLRQKSNRIGGG